MQFDEFRHMHTKLKNSLYKDKYKDRESSDSVMVVCSSLLILA